MSVNGITSANDAYSTYAASSTKTSSAAKAETAAAESGASAVESAGAVYEPSKEGLAAAKKYTPDKTLIAQLKADAEARTSQLRSLVEQMMGKQANAYGNANDIWSFLRKGNYTVDPATRAQAQADIAEDGYWGVNQTSQRILDFATALTGGDPEKIEEMRNAFKKGYKMAEETWGGKLPDICRQTYDAVFKGFDKMAEEAGLES